MVMSLGELLVGHDVRDTFAFNLFRVHLPVSEGHILYMFLVPCFEIGQHDD